MIDLKIPGLRWCSIPFWFVIWYVFANSGLVSSDILPDPRRVAAALYEDAINLILLNHALVSAGRALAGFALAIPVGVLLGALIARVRLVDMLLEPITFMTYPVPKIAFFPILTLAFGVGSPSKIAFAFLESFYPIVAASIFAFRGIRTRLIWAAQSMGATKMQILLRVMIPVALPGIVTGLRIALPVSVLVVIVAEMIGDGRGLGFYIADASLSFQTAKVYAGIIVVGILGFTFDRILVFASKIALPGSR